MTTDPRQQRIDYLWKLQESTSKSVQDIADYMAKTVANKIVLTQEAWDTLIADWEAAEKKMRDIGKRLSELHGL
jgi:K+/H+ antiporter YhaU regulatory subunit KhtT